MNDLRDRIMNLKDDHVLVIINALAGEFSDAGMPEGPAEQVAALEQLFAQTGESFDPAAVDQASLTAAADVGRELLLLLAESNDVAESLQDWLDHPPRQETASATLLLAGPVVLTGCIAVLYVIGRIRFERDSSGRISFEYDGTAASPMDDQLPTISSKLANLLGKLS